MTPLRHIGCDKILVSGVRVNPGRATKLFLDGGHP